MAAYAALVSLINTINQITTHYRLSKSLHDKHTQTLLEKTGLLLEFIEAHNYGVGSKEADDLEREIAFAAHAAEDAIESHVVDQIHAGTCKVSLGCLFHMQRATEDMDAIMVKAKQVEDERCLKEATSTHPAAAVAAAPLVECGEVSVVELDDELTRLLDELTGHQSCRNIISIVGMGGVGKSTLAKNVYENSLIKQHFDIRAWAYISQRYDVKEILSQLLSGLGESSSGNSGDLGLQLHKTLTARRYLIVLDDVWSVEVWDKLRLFFPDNGNGSRVVLTTRLSNVATDCGSSCFKKNLLNEKESWRLFCNKAFQHQDCPPELVGIGKKIVESCKGLPLSIVVIGGSLLKSPRTVGHWEDVAKDIKSIPNSKEKQESLALLFSSYNHLPPHLKPCFLYMGVFKWCYSKIPVSEIIRLWVAEGFLKASGSCVLEEIAEHYIQDLIDRNLILVGRRSDTGKVISYEIHDLLRDLCIKLSLQQGFFVRESECKVGDPNPRRIYLGNAQLKTESPLARTVMAYVADEQVTESPFARSVMAYVADEQVLDKCRLLRVLRLSHYSGGAPQELFRCVNLRHLDFHSTGFEISSSVSLPWNLQTLIYSGNHFPLFAPPIEIWTMQQLRHLEFGRIFLPDPCESEGQDEFVILENLQTLKIAVNLKLCEEVCKLIPNIKELYVDYDDGLHGYDDSLIHCLHNLGRLHKLKSLNLRTPSLRDARLLDFKLTLPASLNELRLMYCRLKWEDVRVLGSLPLLEVLQLSFDSVKEGEPQWSPVDGQFLRLKFLEIDLKHLKHWDADGSHFPVLEKLVLCRLCELEEIPCGIGEIPTLQFISLKWSSFYAAISAIRIKEERLENDESDDLQVQLQINPMDLGDFMKMLKAEGLTTGNIQLEFNY